MTTYLTNDPILRIYLDRFYKQTVITLLAAREVYSEAGLAKFLESEFQLAITESRYNPDYEGSIWLNYAIGLSSC